MQSTNGPVIRTDRQLPEEDAQRTRKHERCPTAFFKEIQTKLHWDCISRSHWLPWRQQRPRRWLCGCKHRQAVLAQLSKTCNLTYTHTLWKHTHAHTHCAHRHTHTETHTCTHKHTHSAHTHAHMHTHIVHTDKHTQTHTHTCIHTHCAHTHMHAHTPNKFVSKAEQVISAG